MGTNLTKLLGGAAAATLLLALPGVAAAENIQGMIISHDGNKLVVRTGGTDTTVIITDTTKIQVVAGAVGLQRNDRPATDLINGLAVSVDIVQNGDETDATKITFKQRDLKTAMAVQAGTAQAKANISAKQAENERRLSQVGQFDTVTSVRILFASGSVAINAQGKQDICAIATQATGTPGYLVRVVGHADSTGNAAANQRLSDQRASAVTAYLVKSCKLPASKMMSATGLGDYVPVENNDTAANQAENRRVTVFIVVSKASETAPAQ